MILHTIILLSTGILLSCHGSDNEADMVMFPDELENYLPQDNKLIPKNDTPKVTEKPTSPSPTTKVSIDEKTNNAKPNGDESANQAGENKNEPGDDISHQNTQDHSENTTPVDENHQLANKNTDQEIVIVRSEGNNHKDQTGNSVADQQEENAVTPRPRRPIIVKMTGGDQVLTLAGEHPLQWHVGIYNKNYVLYKQICGGSLVTQTAVISAAHCFWSFTDMELKPASMFAVAAGKVYRPWNAIENNRIEKRNVVDIKIPPLFYGSDTSLQHDIAAVLLDAPIISTPHIKPICVNFDLDFDKHQLKKGNKGTILGWGLTAEYGNASYILNILELPFVEPKICINQARDYRKYVTPDKFCAGVKTGKAICRGDSGGGLVFFESPRVPFLRGVASSSPIKGDSPCNPEAISAFTHIKALENFLTTHIPDLEEECLENYPDANLIFEKHGIKIKNGINNEYNRNGVEDIDLNQRQKRNGNVNVVKRDQENGKKDNKGTESGKENGEDEKLRNKDKYSTYNNCVCNCNCK